MRELSGSADGFGGDLRFGQATGLAGADELCRTIAERSMAGSSSKGWRAFLSASKGGADGGVVNAIDRIGNGPWYDRLERLVASGPAGLLAADRPEAAAAIQNDLPNEDGVPNHDPGTGQVDNHDTLTGSTKQGQYSASISTCGDWTSLSGAGPMVGHSWPRTPTSARNWRSEHNAPGCAAGVNLSNTMGGSNTVGGAGGYGGIYCFALTP